MKNKIAKRKPDRTTASQSVNAVICQVLLDYKQVQLISSAYLII